MYTRVTPFYYIEAGVFDNFDINLLYLFKHRLPTG